MVTIGGGRSFKVGCQERESGWALPTVVSRRKTLGEAEAVDTLLIKAYLVLILTFSGQIGLHVNYDVLVFKKGVGTFLNTTLLTAVLCLIQLKFLVGVIC